MLKQRPRRVAPAATVRSGRRIRSSRPNHIWLVDLTTVPTLAGFWISWLPWSLPQRWPFCCWAAVVGQRLCGSLPAPPCPLSTATYHTPRRAPDGAFRYARRGHRPSEHRESGVRRVPVGRSLRICLRDGIGRRVCPALCTITERKRALQARGADRTRDRPRTRRPAHPRTHLPRQPPAALFAMRRDWLRNRNSPQTARPGLRRITDLFFATT